MKEEILYIPVNIKKRKEIIEGIGKKEIRQIVITTLIGIFIGAILFFLKNNNPAYLIMTAFIFGSGSYVFLKKDPTNRNTIDKLKLYINFTKSQKRFHYKYKNIYEMK